VGVIRSAAGMCSFVSSGSRYLHFINHKGHGGTQRKDVMELRASILKLENQRILS